MSSNPERSGADPSEASAPVEEVGSGVCGVTMILESPVGEGDGFPHPDSTSPAERSVAPITVAWRDIGFVPSMADLLILLLSLLTEEAQSPATQGGRTPLGCAL